MMEHRGISAFTKAKPVGDWSAKVSVGVQIGAAVSRVAIIA